MTKSAVSFFEQYLEVNAYYDTESYVSGDIRDENRRSIFQMRCLHLSQNCLHEHSGSITDNYLEEHSGIGCYLELIDIVRTYDQEEQSFSRRLPVVRFSITWLLEKHWRNTNIKTLIQHEKHSLKISLRECSYIINKQNQKLTDILRTQKMHQVFIKYYFSIRITLRNLKAICKFRFWWIWKRKLLSVRLNMVRFMKLASYFNVTFVFEQKCNSKC